MKDPTTILPLSSLTVTQQNIRTSDSLPSLIEHAKNGGRFEGICIFSFPDGRNFLHDGHHRVLAIYLSGRKFLDVGEYVIIQSTYEDIGRIFFDKHFVTPYDPRIEMRLSNFGEFKSRAIQLYNDGKEVEAREFIKNNRHQYAIPRRINSLKELAQSVGLIRKQTCKQCEEINDFYSESLSSQLNNKLHHTTQSPADDLQPNGIVSLNIQPFPPQIIRRWNNILGKTTPTNPNINPLVEQKETIHFSSWNELSTFSGITITCDHDLFQINENQGKIIYDYSTTLLSIEIKFSKLVTN